MEDIYKQEKMNKVFNLISSSGNVKPARGKVNLKIKMMGYTDEDVCTARTLVCGQSLVALSGRVSKRVKEAFEIWKSLGKIEELDSKDNQNITSDQKELYQGLMRTPVDDDLIQISYGDFRMMMSMIMKCTTERISDQDVLKVNKLIDKYSELDLV